jgi:hypothetical protein
MVDTATYDAHGGLALALATWLMLLQRRGLTPVDPQVRGLCEGLTAATGPDEGDAAAEVLLAHLVERLGPSPDPDTVFALALEVFGQGITHGFPGASRAERISAIRRHQFGGGAPWLARIWERSAAGRVGPRWLVVQEVTDQVLTLDRGTTSGLLVHDQNDLGILGSLPARIDRELLASWAEAVPELQRPLVEALVRCVPSSGDLTNAVKLDLAREVRSFYRAHPAALALQASGGTLPPTVANHRG